MYLLKKNYAIFCLLVVTFFSCSSRGPLTPEEAYYKLRYYVKTSEIDSFVKLLSVGSIEKINNIKEFFLRMSADQLKLLSERYGISEEKIRSLTVENYVKIYFLDGQKNDIITKAVNSEIISVNTHGNRSKIMMENGHYLFFVKEGPYWKFEMSML